MHEPSPPSSSLLTLRKYQEIICQQAVSTNTIAFLPTGTDKTLIVCYVSAHRFPKLRLLVNFKTLGTLLLRFLVDHHSIVQFEAFASVDNGGW